jgi:hypothetical protein
VKHWLISRRQGQGFLRALGLRADARLYLLDGGISVADRPRRHAAASGSVFIGF